MTLLTGCRTCLAPNPYMFLPMGDHPPANSFVRAEDVGKNQPAYPLDTQVCLECGLIQVADQVPEGFFEHYLYVPSSATLMHSHFAELAEILKNEANSGLVVDIGCNDGLLLSACNKLGCRTVGVDPAANLAEVALTRGVEVEVGYFSDAAAKDLVDKHGRAAVIVTTNTFNHIGNLHDFMAGVSQWLADDGVMVIEVPWAKELLEKNEFDTIYHEHVSEFSLLSLVKLGAFFGLVVADVHRLGVHGGSMRVFLRRAAAVTSVKPIVPEMLAEERDAGMLSIETYQAFSARVDKVRLDLNAILADLHSQGLKVAGYGAPAKGNTLLNFFKIGPGNLDYLVDRNALKQGLFSPGMKIPIRSPEALLDAERPDVLLVLAWNFFDEIRLQQEDFAAHGGRFLVPLPTPVLVN
ncbi:MULTISPECIES: class I SAM-dependent methyltransferase [unclassified Mesorhizobium]|uniref:class I SAM-dependent methyltransferase n=1 Tax=unclassified Mesorhizobium TaxID=325217 RepID=UPI000FDA1775|nr:MULTISPECIES: class I SAM-dependent methyltransferase [unclassified Mesorhizobium]TGQ42027.1 class I SAM-dependent methyltransferase [Mesorhizobium sp. M00.F.Ca.ET.216.01.1.1]TIS55060.1 MAG: class I SAM-dependent methyltransferase [Mesorhizobium sp.]TIS92948.1 MAG: class I SAM-dependent methyltransferase [Mesorhizobium sp.]TJW14867.1 MAG: class I SAM-dependent methyltransferase [Mesorhizobium sp.]TJW48925.1 MAG: class I SAM-dependent methyltransferase [Mesorhizobium sp.]